MRYSTDCNSSWVKPMRCHATVCKYWSESNTNSRAHVDLLLSLVTEAREGLSWLNTVGRRGRCVHVWLGHICKVCRVRKEAQGRSSCRFSRVFPGHLASRCAKAGAFCSRYHRESSPPGKRPEGTQKKEKIGSESGNTSKKQEHFCGKW